MFQIIIMVAVSTVVPAEYRTQESTEEDDHEEEEKTAVDYRKYFGGFGDVIGRTARDQPFDRPSGFNHPSGLMDFFPDGPVGLYGMPGGTFRDGLSTSPTAGVSSDLGLPFPSNGSGFVENIKFQSFFDTSSSASESDIRPHTFRQRLRSKPPHSVGGFFSPNFAVLKRGVDREVGYQKKEGSVVGSRKSASRKKSRQDSGELDGFDFSEFDFDESSEQDSTEQSSEEQQNDNNEGGGSTEDTSKELNPVTPYSVVNHYHSPPHGPSPNDNVPKPPLTRPYNPQEQSLPKRNPGRFESLPNYYNTQQFPVTPAITPHSNLYYRPLVYNSPANLNGYTRAQYPLVRSNVQAVPLYKPVLPNSGGIPHISRNLNLHYRPKPLFTPSPRDVYLDYSKNTPLAKRRTYPISATPRRIALRSYSQIDRDSGVPRRVKSPAVSAYKQKKFCKKAHKKMNSREFPKFEQQQMVCYTCTDKAKNSTYEECRYGSEPDDDGSFYERVSETRSLKTVLPATPAHARHERSVGKSNEKIRTSSSKHAWIVNRNRREYDDDDDGGDSEEQSQDDDRYTHDVDHSPFSSEERDDWSGENDEYNFEEDDSEEISDIEREFQSPKTSDDGSCHEVMKRGLTCMVCKNSKTGSSSEQCSYSSDPDDNKYEYSSQSSYGSGKNPSTNRNKRLNRIDNNLDRGFNQNPPPEKRQNRLANLKNGNRRHIDLKNRTFKTNDGEANSESSKNAVKLQREELKIDALSEIGLPGLVEPDPSTKSLLGQPDSLKNNSKKGRHMRRRGSVLAEKTDKSTADVGADNNNPTQKTSSYRFLPKVKKTHPYNGESLKLRPRVGQKNKNRETTTGLYTKYLDTPAENGGRMEIERKQSGNKAKTITGYEARMLPRTVFDGDDSEEDRVQNIDKFKNKDRSDCTRIMRGHLTCYRCFGLDGVRHEECLYENSTDPESRHPQDEHLQQQNVKELIKGR